MEEKEGNLRDFFFLVKIILFFFFVTPMWNVEMLMIFFFWVVMSEDMVRDEYKDIMNIDISSVAIEMMKRKHESVPQLKCILYLSIAAKIL